MGIDKIAFAGPLCKCGCDESVKWNIGRRCWNKYLKGHYEKTPEARENGRKAALIQIPYERTPEHKERMRQAHLGRKCPWTSERNRIQIRVEGKIPITSMAKPKAINVLSVINEYGSVQPYVKAALIEAQIIQDIKAWRGSLRSGFDSYMNIKTGVQM